MPRQCFEKNSGPLIIQYYKRYLAIWFDDITIYLFFASNTSVQILYSMVLFIYV